jgi:ferric-dicitrate binding protein FerR (iron transport regulator)
MPNDSTHDPVSADEVERLLRQAGRRTTAPPDRREHARAAVRDAWRDTVRTRTRRRAMRLAIPAVAAAAVIAMVTVRQARTPVADVAAGREVTRIVTSTAAVRTTTAAGLRVDAAGDPIPAGATVETPAGVIATFALTGGGELRQNGDAAVRWTGPRRVTLERGEIYVDSESPGGGAIAIETPAGIVRDIGTRFAVRVDARGLHVRVRDGIVRLDTAGGSHQATVGTALSADRSGAVRTGATATVGPEWDWILRGTTFTLEGATLEQFLGWVHADGGLRVEIADAAIAARMGSRVLHGSIAGLTVAEALDAVLPTLGLAHRLDGARVIVSAARDGSS